MTNLRIRSAMAKDAAAAARLLSASITKLCAADHGSDPAEIAAWTANKTPDQVKAWIKRADGLFLVAEVGGTLAGVGHASPNGVILLNYVAPDFRFRGVSRTILRQLEAEIAATGQANGTLISTQTALELYRAEGWRSAAPVHDVTGYPMTKTLPQIRLLTTADAQLWRDLRLDALRTAPEAFSSQYADWADRPLAEFTAHLRAHRIFAAMVDGVPVGCARWSKDDDKLCRVTSVFVKPRARGRGIAAALMAAIKRNARAAGAATLFLDVGRKNSAAEHVYQIAGFETLPDADRPPGSCDACELTMRATL